MVRRVGGNMRIAIAIGISLLASSAWAQSARPASANLLLPGCRQIVFDHITGETAFNAGWCMGAVVALAQPSLGVCAPQGVTPEQATRVVIAYVDARPARLNESFYYLATEAMKAAWPCKR